MASGNGSVGGRWSKLPRVLGESFNIVADEKRKLTTFMSLLHAKNKIDYINRRSVFYRDLSRDHWKDDQDENFQVEALRYTNLTISTGRWFPQIFLGLISGLGYLSEFEQETASEYFFWICSICPWFWVIVSSLMWLLNIYARSYSSCPLLHLAY